VPLRRTYSSPAARANRAAAPEGRPYGLEPPPLGAAGAVDPCGAADGVVALGVVDWGVAEDGVDVVGGVVVLCWG